MGITSTLLLMEMAAVRDSRLRKLLSFRPLVFVGTFAFTLYLVHAPLLQLASQYILSGAALPESGKAILLCFVGTPIIIGISYPIYLLCERPFHLWAKSLGNRPHKA